MRMFNRDWHFILLIHLLHKKVQTIMPHHVTHVNKAFIVDKLLLLTNIIVLPIIVLIFVIAPSDWISDLQN